MPPISGGNTTTTSTGGRSKAAATAAADDAGTGLTFEIIMCVQRVHVLVSHMICA
jgi:hypothetical protein